jgi:hypothetical protein
MNFKLKNILNCRIAQILQIKSNISYFVPVGRPRLRWEDIRRDSVLLLRIRDWRRLARDRDICRPGPDAGCCV